MKTALIMSNIVQLSQNKAGSITLFWGRTSALIGAESAQNVRRSETSASGSTSRYVKVHKKLDDRTHTPSEHKREMKKQQLVSRLASWSKKLLLRSGYCVSCERAICHPCHEPNQTYVRRLDRTYEPPCMFVLTNKRPSDCCNRSCIGFFPSVPAGSMHRRRHSIQMVWLRAIKHGLSNRRGGMHHAAIETQRRRPSLVSSIVIAGPNHFLINDRRQILAYCVVHKRHTVTSIGIIWQSGTQNKKDAHGGFIAPGIVESFELITASGE